MKKNWAEEELSDINLGDERLNKRSKTLLAALGEKPAASIPQACSGWGETMAAYLLRNKVPPAKPRLNEVLRQIACLGGFLARKSDGEPGVKTIWLGLKAVHVAVKAIRALRRTGIQKTCV